MASEALEHMLGDVRGFDQSIDVYAAGTIALYTPRPEPTYNGAGMDLGPGPICDRRYEYERPIGESYGLPSQWEPPSDYGIGGPGEARVVFPGLVERERVDFSRHDGLGIHNNIDYFTILNPTEPITPDKSIHFKEW